MKIKLQSFIIASALVTINVTAQETMEFKIKTLTPPTYYHQVAMAAGYNNANRSTVDLFGKGGSEIVSIPSNYVGSQESVDGDNYFGLITFYGKNNGFTDDVNYAEFLQATLPSSLTAGKLYEVSFKISLADNSGFATSGWGALFTENKLKKSSDYSRLTTVPQVSFTEMVKDKSGWVQLKAQFTATGKEKLITIGTFAKDFKLENVGGGSGFAGTKAYYYLSSIKINEAILDRDKDGILDKDDKCPDVFGLAKFIGCPDTDGDGITDAEDKCPTVAGVSKFMGCPDTDGDGIADAEDNCPTVAGVLSNKGCPAVVEAPVNVVQKKAAEVFKKAMTGIQFESGKDIIKKVSYPILDNVASVLKGNPTWDTGIEGHTDNVGDAAQNKELSNKRAIAVMNYLKAKGVTNKMTPEGFGVERPIADNKTPAGRAKNRRVEFKVSYEQ